MAISKITSSGLAGDKYNVMTAGNNYYEPLASTLLTTTSTGVTFSNIPQTYKHLQIRCFTIMSLSDSYSKMTFNSDTSSNYATHELTGQGASASSTGTASAAFIYATLSSGTYSNPLGSTIIDVLDYTNTNKNKTARNLCGSDGNGAGWIMMRSGVWMSTSAITSITLTPAGAGTFNTYSRFSLYGLKG
jgi:hypothetical protein